MLWHVDLVPVESIDEVVVGITAHVDVLAAQHVPRLLVIVLAHEHLPIL